MIVREHEPLSPRTSLAVGGRARYFVEAHSDELGDVAAFACAARAPIRMLGAGTNILVPEAGTDALVLSIRDDTIEFDGPLVTAGASARWDDLVGAAARRSLWGIENLAGIPGSVGGALVQNIGAYGAELSSTFVCARVFDFAQGAIREIGKEDASLGYRTSSFKRDRDSAILSVTLRLSPAGVPNLAYADLMRAASEGVPLGTPREVAHAVREIRAGKFPPAGEGSAGSFFKNPVISETSFAELEARVPGVPGFRAEGAMKISLAWLLDHALGLKGYRKGAVRLFERQPLVIVADPGARAQDVDSFAAEIEARVHEAFAIAIEREVETFDA